jgi:hypothetical protein
MTLRSLKYEGIAALQNAHLLFDLLSAGIFLTRKSHADDGCY